MNASPRKPTSMEIQPLSYDERMALLRAQPWFEKSLWHSLGEIVRSMLVYHAAAGTRICTEDDAETYLFLLVEGEVSVRKRRADSTDEHPIVTLGAGQTFGEMSLLDGGPRSASVDAETDCTLFVLTRDTLMHLVEDRPEVAVHLLMKLAASLSRRLRLMDIAFVGGAGQG
jgi:CRP/FNR family transcriptional regulator, cyclic AMP receptor protein